MAKPTIAALVPMRHRSERVPGKNYRHFNGKPLYHHIVATLLECPMIDSVVIDTDSELILEDAARYFPDVQLYKRPEHLRDGHIPMNDVLKNLILNFESDFYVQTHSTNPLLKHETIEKALIYFLSCFPDHDSLFSVTRMQSRLWDSDIKPINHNPLILQRTQDLNPVFEENSNLYVFPKYVLEKLNNRIGQNPITFEIDRVESTDIDEEIDFITAEFYQNQRI